MTHLQKVSAYFARRWISYSLVLNTLKSPQPPEFKLQSIRFYGKKAVRLENYLRTGETCIANKGNGGKTSRANWQDAQVALVEYLHSTRGLHFMDADLIAKYSPRFLQKLLEKVVDHEPEERARSLVRFLRYYPINEFEPFFESIGLEPSEYISLLPRGFMFLNEDAHLLENYHVLCNYGIPRNDIGRIYKEARVVFGYDGGVLYSKLRALEGFKISQCDVIKAVSSDPYLLIGNWYKDFGCVLENLKTLGFQSSWIKRNFPRNRVNNWRQIHELLCLLGALGCNKQELENLISRHPELLFESSGGFTFSLIVFVLKLGFTGKDICCMFVEFPKVQVSKFVSNLKGAFLFLNEMEMDPADVESIIRSHYTWLGLCSLLKSATVLIYLHASKKRACDFIKENPLVLKKWVRGSKVKQLPNIVNEAEERSKREKINFLLNLGFTEDSKKMSDALKVFRGRGDELQERFNCLVGAGLDPEDVSKMIKAAPKILNQSKETLLKKIDCIVSELGYPISDLVSFPSCIAYSADRARLRYSMYKWLCDQGIADPKLALSTFIACSDMVFIKTYVNSHPKGPEVWEKLKKKIYPV